MKFWLPRLLRQIVVVEEVSASVWSGEKNKTPFGWSEERRHRCVCCNNKPFGADSQKYVHQHNTGIPGTHQQVFARNLRVLTPHGGRCTFFGARTTSTNTTRNAYWLTLLGATARANHLVGLTSHVPAASIRPCRCLGRHRQSSSSSLSCIIYESHSRRALALWSSNEAHSSTSSSYPKTRRLTCPTWVSQKLAPAQTQY